MAGGKIAVSVSLMQKYKKTYDDILEFIKRYVEEHDDKLVLHAYIDDTGELLLPRLPMKVYAKKSRLCFSITSSSKYVSYVRIEGREEYEDLIKEFVKHFEDNIGGVIVWENSIR